MFEMGEIELPSEIARLLTLDLVRWFKDPPAWNTFAVFAHERGGGCGNPFEGVAIALARP